MTIYIDAIWFLNWIFDTSLLVWTAVLLKNQIKWIRVITGGLVGSLVVWLYITPYSYLADQIWLKSMVSILMILAAFGFRNIRAFIKKIVTLYAVTFTFGGILLGSHYFFSFKVTEYFNGFTSGSGSFGDPVSWIFVIVGFPLAWHFSKKHINILDLAKWNKEQRVKMFVEINGVSFESEGLVDTGNQLLDPLSGSPVTIISLYGKESLLPAAVTKLVESGLKNMNVDFTGFPDGWQEKMRIIPCKVVGNESQLLIAFKPDMLSIQVANEYRAVHKCLISFTMQQLSGEGLFDSIVHPKMVPVGDSASAS
jgi:stage II sporulation protein GA (sporulation sigma-E factor processing peptidase)